MSCRDLSITFLYPLLNRRCFFSEIVDEAVRAAVRAGVPTRGGARLPVIVSHDDVVVRLPEGAVLLASSAGAPVQAWRVGGLLALQHHPESTPARIEYVGKEPFLTSGKALLKINLDVFMITPRIQLVEAERM